MFALPLFIDLEDACASRHEATFRNHEFGAPGIRDPENLCDAFDPGEPAVDNRCDSDGHYLCMECKHLRLCEGGCGARATQCECVYCKTCWRRIDDCACPRIEVSSG